MLDTYFSSNYYDRDFTDLRHSSSTSVARSMPRLSSISPANRFLNFFKFIATGDPMSGLPKVTHLPVTDRCVCDPPCNQSLSFKRFFFSARHMYEQNEQNVRLSRSAQPANSLSFRSTQRAYAGSER